MNRIQVKTFETGNECILVLIGDLLLHVGINEIQTFRGRNQPDRRLSDIQVGRVEEND